MKVSYFMDRMPVQEEKWEEFSQYLGLMKSHLDEVSSKWENERREEEPQIQEEYSENFRQFCEDYQDVLSQFNIFLLNSFFAYSYFLFEYGLMEMCQRSKDIHGSSFSVKDIKARTDLGRFKKYMKRLGVNFPTNTPEWTDVQRFNKIRNAIAHNGAIVVPSTWRTCELEYADEKGLLVESDTDTCLELTQSFCQEALDICQRFLLMVWQADPQTPETS